MKALNFSGDKLNGSQKKQEFCKGEDTKHGRQGLNAGCQHFQIFLQCFHKASFSGSLKAGIVW